MINLFIVMPLAGLFMLLNVFLGCYLAISRGYGPPHWIIALNLVVRVTSFQNWLNGWRGELERRFPRIEKLLARFHIPKPIVLVDVLAPEEGSEPEENDAEEGQPEKDEPEDGKIEKSELDDLEEGANKMNDEPVEETANS